jgi:hypothetical protein
LHSHSTVLPAFLPTFSSFADSFAVFNTVFGFAVVTQHPLKSCGLKRELLATGKRFGCAVWHSCSPLRCRAQHHRRIAVRTQYVGLLVRHSVSVDSAGSNGADEGWLRMARRHVAALPLTRLSLALLNLLWEHSERLCCCNTASSQILRPPPARRNNLKISINTNIDTTIPVTSPTKRADAVGRSLSKKIVVPNEFRTEAAPPASKMSRQLTRSDLCSRKSIPSSAKNQKLSAAQNTPKNTATM